MLQINEMVIRTSLGANEAAGNQIAAPVPDEEMIEKIIAQCLERVKEMLNDEKER